MNLLSQGAEAKLFLTKHNQSVLKDRFRKKYRCAELDEKLRKQRTKKEAKVLEDLYSLGFVPKLLKKEAFSIEMEYLAGKRIRDVLSQENYASLCTEIGTKIRKLHDKSIIHGDLTTSNMILKDAVVYFIDFGLSFHSDKVEDKAVDLHVLKETLESKHCAIWQECFAEVMKAYDDPIVLKRLKEVEKRGRYR